MALSKETAPGNRTTKAGTAETPSTPDTGSTSPKTEAETTNPGLVNAANPEGKTNVSTGPQGPDEVVAGAEHVLGDDPRRVKLAYHDSQSGRAVDADGNFLDGVDGEGPIPKHRVVADDWPTRLEKHDDPRNRKGNEAGDSGE